MTSPMNAIVSGAEWRAIKSRLDSATMREICNPTGATAKPCVYVAGLDDFSAPEGAESQDWGRVVVVPIETLWPIEEVEGQTRKIAFLVRVEFNRYQAAGYDPNRGLELAHREAYALLQRWTPVDLDEVLVAFPIYRQEAPQPIPQADDARGLVFKSASYRTELAGA